MSEERKGPCCGHRSGWPVIVSLALNLFLVGVLAAPFLTPHPAVDMQASGNFMPPPPPHGPGFMLERLGQSLSPDDAAKVRAIFDEEREGLRTSHGAMRQTMRKLAEMLKAETPDLEAFRAVVNDVRTSGQGFHERMAKALERIATEISVEGRRKIAEQMLQGGPFDGREPGGPPPGGPMDLPLQGAGTVPPDLSVAPPISAPQPEPPPGAAPQQP